MKTFASSPPRAGTALVLVLSFILLLSVLLTAFLSRAMLNRQIAYSSMGQFKADQVAQSGVSTFLGDLRQEIIAGSRQDNDPINTHYTINGVTIYMPTAPSAVGVTTAAPARIGEDAGLKTLLRRSVRSDQSGTPTAFPSQGGVAPFDPGVYTNTTAVPPNRASPSSSKNASVNGHAITITRWNKAALIDPALVSATPAATGFQPPDWVILTRVGAKAFGGWSSSLADPSVSQTNYALGRYAYTVYNEGALLDANLAGFPPGFDQAGDSVVRNTSSKQAPFFADLRNLDGGILTSGQVDSFVKWRNASTALDPTAFINFATTIASARGFIGVSTGDQGLVSRQDLLGYAQASGWNAEALRFLGTSSREYNSSNYCPKNVTTTNPNFALMVVPASTPGGVGTPLRRFPLNTNLAILEAATDTASIQKDFGLTAIQNNPNPAVNSGPTHRHWQYKNSQIMTLAAAIADHGQPDFFELLKAAIGAPSLGQAYHHTYIQYGTDDLYTPDSLPDEQIIRIGANIIDQHKRDNFPTTILFNGFDFAGIENLPYFGGLNIQLYRPGSSDGWDQKSTHYLYFTLWNPHQPELQTNLLGPTNVRVTVNPQAFYCMHYWTYAHGYRETHPINANEYQSFPGYALNSAPLSKVDYREPDVMKNTDDTGSITILPGNVPNQQVNAYVFPDPKAVQAGTVTEYTPGNYGIIKTWSNDSIILDNITFRLEYFDGSNWYPYTTLGGYMIDGGDEHGYTGLQNEGEPVIRPGENTGIYPTVRMVKPDPRTFRYGVNLHYPPPDPPPILPIPGDYPEKGMVPGATPGELGGNNVGDASNYPGANQYYPGMLFQNLQANGIYTTGSDGVVRPADGSLDANAANPMHPSSGTVNPARPVILHRPFRSVGELGYVFRDEPWKTLDLFSPNSADAALLDVFCLDDTDTVAGRVDIRTSNAQVVQALVGGSLRQESTVSSGISMSDAGTIGNDLVTRSQTKPMVSKADLVTQFATTTVDKGVNPAVKTQREAVVRALGQNMSARTWNLMVDLVAQAGHYGPNATGLDQFIVEGEKRCWLHLAIDRYTGKVVSQSMEQVNE